jgi:hypothetical protein
MPDPRSRKYRFVVGFHVIKGVCILRENKSDGTSFDTEHANQEEAAAEVRARGGTKIFYPDNNVLLPADLTPAGLGREYEERMLKAWQNYQPRKVR